MIDRVKKIILLSGLSDAAFAKKLNIQQQTLWRQLNGARKVSLETVIAIAEAFPDIDCNWIIRGDGDMNISSNNTNNSKIDNLVDVISMQQETIKNLIEKIKQLKNN